MYVYYPSDCIAVWGLLGRFKFRLLRRKGYSCCCNVCLQGWERMLTVKNSFEVAVVKKETCDKINEEFIRTQL